MFIPQDAYITKNFKYKELYGNKPENLPFNEFQFLNMIYGCINILQPIREKFGRITVSSGRRSKFYNKKIGGSITSQHISGEAFDIVPMEIDAITVFKWCVDNLDYDQIIFENRNNVTSWIHISTKRIGENRKQALTSFKKGQYKIYGGN